MKFRTNSRLTPVKLKLFTLFLIPGTLIFSSLFCYNPCLAQNQNHVILTDDKDTYEIGPYLEILEDKSGKLTIDDVSSPAFSGRFIKNNEKAPNFGYTSSVYWVRFKIFNNSKKTSNWLLEQENVFIYYIDFYKPTGLKNQYIVKELGFLRPAKTRDINNHRFIFNLFVPRKSEEIIYLRFKSENAIIIQLSIHSKDRFINTTSIEYFMIGLFYGILLIMLGYNLFLFISLKRLDYFYYIAILLCSLVLDLSHSGIGPYYIWPNSIRFNYMSINLSTSFLLIAIMKYTEAFLNMKESMPVLYKLSIFISVIQAIFIMFTPFAKNSILIPPLTAIFIAGSILSFSSSIISLKQGNRRVHYYLIGWLILLLGISIFIFTPFNLFPFNVFTKNFQKIAMIGSALFWSLAIGDQVNILKDKLEIANINLQKSEEKLRIAFNQSFQLTGLLSPEGNVIAANETALSFDHIKESDILGKPLWYVPWWSDPEHRAKLKETIELAAEGETVRFITTNTDETGVLRHIDFSIKPIRDNTERVILLMAEGRDITERVEAEKESKRLVAILESTIDLVATSTRDGRLTYVNRAGRRMLNWPENGSLDGKIISDAHSPSDFKIIAEEGIPAAIRDGTWQGETKILSSDGKEINVRQIIMAHKSPDGEVEFLSSTMHDITERIESKLAIIENEKQYRTTINAMRDMIHVTDRDLNIILFNTAMIEMNKNLGLDTNVAGKNLKEVFPFLNDKVIEEYKNVINTGETFISEETTQIKNKKFITETGKTPIIEQGIVAKIVTVIRDITERKQTEEQLRQAQKMEIVGTLAGGLAHDFNNVLNGIMGSVTLIKYQIEDSEKIEKGTIGEYIEIILKSSQRAADMIQRLLTLSRKKELAITPIDLNLTLDQVIKICEKTLDKSVKLIPRYFKNRAIALADATQIEQVLLNICVNSEHAMTFMRPKNEKWGGTLSVELKHFAADKYFCKTHPGAKEDNYWVFSITDTGIGMDPETLSKIFNPFFTTKEDGKGTGLGLSMAYNIVKQHNGFIDIYSKKDEGTILSIYLPVPREVKIVSEDKTDKSININIPVGNGLILITDDEEITRQTAGNMLETCGYEVITAENGIECVEIYMKRNKEIKAVLLDMAMPEMSGKDAYLKIKEINPGVKVLFSSGFKQDSRIDEVLKLGANGFIQKPYTFAQLAKYIKQVLNGN